MTCKTVLHLFAGSGGTGLGFQRAGFRSAGAIDYDPRACQDYERLTGERALCRDIARMGPADLRREVKQCPDVVAMSAPCVGFSGCLAESLSKTEKYQEFNSLALHGIQLVLEAWRDAPTGRRVPGLIVFENVPRIKSRGKELLRHITGLLHKSGYAVHMSSHDCGELGEGLAQKRPRFLLVARHMATVPDFLRKPARHRPLAIREVLWQLPRPRPDGQGAHREPALSNRNKLRLGCIGAGEDWRVLPPEVYLYHCESHELEAVTGLRWRHCTGRHDGKLGVLDWELPARTVIGNARVCNTWASVADPRVAWSSDGAYKDRPGGYGVADPAEPSATIRGKQVLVNSASAVADPRLGCDQRAEAYGVRPGDQPAPVIVGHHKHDRVAGSVADPRLSDPGARRRGQPQRGSFGVQAGGEPSSTIRGCHSARQAPGAVADPRLGKKGRRPEPRLPQYDENGWPVPTHELVRLADGRLVLYGPPLDLDATDASVVIRAPDGTCHRPLTDAELALLQGFPVGFEFCGPSSCGKPLADGTPQTGRRKRTGNAVPPPTAYAVGEQCMDTLIASDAGGFRLAGGDIWVRQPAQEGARA